MSSENTVILSLAGYNQIKAENTKAAKVQKDMEKFLSISAGDPALLSKLSDTF